MFFAGVTAIPRATRLPRAVHFAVQSLLKTKGAYCARTTWSRHFFGPVSFRVQKLCRLPPLTRNGAGPLLVVSRASLKARLTARGAWRGKPSTTAETQKHPKTPGAGSGYRQRPADPEPVLRCGKNFTYSAGLGVGERASRQTHPRPRGRDSDKQT